MLTFTDLQYFEATLRLGSISSAAEEQFVSQPTISASIKKTEEYFGKDLFTRTGNGLIPTKYSLELFPIVQSLLSLQTDFFSIASKEHHYDSINIAIYSIPLQKTITYLTKAMFNQSHPQIPVNIVEYNFSYIPDFQQCFFVLFSSRFYKNASFRKILSNIPHLKIQQIMTDSFCFVYNTAIKCSRKTSAPVKINTIFSLENYSFFDRKNLPTHLKKLGIILDGQIVPMNANSYDEILNYVRSDKTCSAILPQNFMRPFNAELNSLEVSAIDSNPLHHYIAYNHIALKQFPEAQVFLQLLISASKKYS